MDQKLYNSYVKILKNELVPAARMYRTDCDCLCGCESTRGARTDAGED